MAGLAGLLAVVVLLAAGAPGAYAQAGAATVEVLNAQPERVAVPGQGQAVAPGVRVAVTVRGVDGQVAERATVTLEGTGPDGARVGPVPLVPGPAPGVYLAVAAVPVPGTWDLTVTSAAPAASATARVEVAQPEPLPTTTAPGGTGSTTGPGGTGGSDGSAGDGTPATEEGGFGLGERIAFGLVGAGLALIAFTRLRARGRERREQRALERARGGYDDDLPAMARAAEALRKARESGAAQGTGIRRPPRPAGTVAMGGDSPEEGQGAEPTPGPGSQPGPEPPAPGAPEDQAGAAPGPADRPSRNGSTGPEPDQHS